MPTGKTLPDRQHFRFNAEQWTAFQASVFRAQSCRRPRTIRNHSLAGANSYQKDLGFQLTGLDLIAPSVGRWEPTGQFDLITCVHGLHYIGDKLGLLAMHLDYQNLPAVDSYYHRTSPPRQVSR